jgi:hypothetical protein
VELEQPSLFGGVDMAVEITKFIRALLLQPRRPSALELIKELESELGIEARWDFIATLQGMAGSDDVKRADRDYMTALIEDGSVAKALRGEDAPDREMISTIDLLLEQSRTYRSSPAFREMIEFMGRFRDSGNGARSSRR